MIRQTSLSEIILQTLENYRTLLIKNHELLRVLGRDFTSSNGRTRGGSTVMGLYLCRKLSRFLELELHITSEEGVGTCVTFAFPSKENLTKL